MTIEMKQKVIERCLRLRRDALLEAEEDILVDTDLPNKDLVVEVLRREITDITVTLTELEQNKIRLATVPF